MNALELQQRIRLGEDSTLELKRLVWRGTGKINDPHPNSVADELAALANAQGGVLVLGVDDATRDITGIDLAQMDAVEQWLGNLARDLVEPELFFQTRHLELLDASGASKAVLAVTVPKSLWIHRSPGGYLHRVGHEKQKMSTDYLLRLGQQRSQARLIRFEEQAVTHASPTALVPYYTRTYLREDQGDEATQLRRLHLLTSDADGNPCLTVAGVLLCTENPSEWIRGAYIQAVAYRGVKNDPADQIDAKDFTGPITDQIWDAFNFAMRHMQVPATKALGRVEFPQYSRRAVFEALVNAVAHRDHSIHGAKIRFFMFADRLEVCVPGPLANTMSIEAMTQMSLPRNDVLCSLLSRVPMKEFDLGRQYVMDKRGAGVDVILKESQALSGRQPMYRQIGDLELQLTIYAAPSPHAD
jgi:predicted HTH transcriptional regulator